jgi:hypothetical protein
LNKTLLASGVSAVLGLTSSVSFAEPIKQVKQVDSTPVLSEDVPYLHPLLRDGMPVKKLPFDDLNSPNSSRYAVMEEISVDEYGVKTKNSGVVEVDKKPLSPKERQEIAAEKKKRHGSPKQRNKPSKIGHGLAKAIEMRSANASKERAGNGSEPIEVVISVTRVLQPPLFDKMEKAIAKGKILTKADHKRVKGELLAERQREIKDAKFSVLDAIAELGGKVTFNAENLHSIVAHIPADAVNELAQRSDVARIDLNIPLEDEVDGRHIIEGHQIKQFIDSGYDGYNGSYPYYIYFSQIEPNGADNEHVGFLNCIYRLYNCDGGSCTSTTNFTYSQESDHASAVAGLICGDLRDGQDPNVTSSSARIARSGYAGEARGWLYRGTDLNAAMDHIAGQTGGTKSAVANLSAGSSADPYCAGIDTLSINANEMFESGTLLFKSAGNAGHSSTTDCTVTSPGSAIGVFTVGSLGEYSEYISGNTTTVRNATISSFSSRGGTSSEGGGRTIIDIAAYGCRTLMFDKSGGYTYSACGTSFAAPTVTATAIDFIDFYHQEYSDFIDNPGILFANLLLMGNRKHQYSTTTKLTSGFDNLYGAGALRARQFDNSGMDFPWGWGTGWTCIDNNETHTITVNGGNTISSDVEAFEAVLWWYDARHEDDGTLDDIDMTLRTTGGSYLRGSYSYDNKERVFHDVGGLAVKLDIYGYNVTADNAGCGTNSMKVYYAYFYEDSDRDDYDGPGSEIEAE